jgi:hypothetical protein
VFGTAVAGGVLLVGDINQDKSVNVKDVTAILGALTNMADYESTYHLSPTAAATVLDVNQDSQMNNSDLQWLLDYLKGGAGAGDLSIGTAGRVCNCGGRHEFSVSEAAIAR